MINRYADYAANERTYLGWVRTAIAVMAFGFLVEKSFRKLCGAVAASVPFMAIGGGAGWEARGWGRCGRWPRVGGRAIPDAGQAAAQFMHQDGAGSRLTLLVGAGGTGDTRFRFVQDAGFAAFSWVDDGLSFVSVAGLAGCLREAAVCRWPCGRCPPSWL